MTGKYLITADNWFYAPDGVLYKAVWGEVTILEDNILNIKTNRNSSNWFARIGTEENHVIIAGCQIHYAVKTNKKPNSGLIRDYNIVDGVVKEYDRPNNIYIIE
jgi:hypothetical protein